MYVPGRPMWTLLNIGLIQLFLFFEYAVMIWWWCCRGHWPRIVHWIWNRVAAVEAGPLSHTIRGYLLKQYKMNKLLKCTGYSRNTTRWKQSCSSFLLVVILVSTFIQVWLPINCDNNFSFYQSELKCRLICQKLCSELWLNRSCSLSRATAPEIPRTLSYSL